MIDQLVSGAPQAQPQVKGSQGGRQQGDADQGETSGKFDDMVAKAGTRGQRDERQATDKSGKNPDGGDDKARLLDGLSKLTSNLDALLQGMATATNAEGRVQIENFKDVLKKVDLKEQPADEQEAIIAKLFEKLKQAAADQTQRLRNDDAKATDAEAQVELSPADELGMLLGLVAGDGQAKADKKDGAVAAKGDEDADTASATDIATAELDAKSADQPASAVVADNGKQAMELPRQDRQDRPARDETVQVVSADGRGRPVDISVAKASTDATKETDKSQTSARIDTATVLEARRYLGFTPDTNATALANAAKADPSWSSALQAVQRVETVTSLASTVSEVNTLKLQMNPENLGNMVASLKIKDEVLTVEVRVDSVEAYRHLSADHDDIVKALQDQGFSIDKVTVQLNATERTDAGTDRDTRQGQAQREGQDGRSGRNDGDRQPGQPASQQAWGADQSLVNADPGDGNVRTRDSGNIYL